ncbi:hypothetical protein GYMLUDRAFT_152214 [Collybiopsis luxurians FD-317 M1]|nr:hypothetical protein GYMLUDRAFT_152214 [Collybiopsis luxurians FD-317 M1]
MNFVPFISSGASSRLYYVLVRKVESAPSAQAVDDIVLAEVESIVEKLRDANLTTSLCREYLIILLYCITASVVSIPSLDSVLPHAVNLAEAGHGIAEKRIGYLFCAEMMLPRHQLQLMLVNTLRKDLESPNIPNICLALDHLIQCSSEDVIPAIQSRLQDLLSHNSPLVRRRALLAFKALSVHDTELMSRIQQSIIRRMRDQDSTVYGAALIAACRLYEVGAKGFPGTLLGRFMRYEQVHEPARVEIQQVVSELFHATWSKNYDAGQRNILVRLLPAMRTIGLSDSDLLLLSRVIKHASRRKDFGQFTLSFDSVHYSRLKVLLRSAFLCLPAFQAQTALPISPISHVRSLLTSRESNEKYLFLTCLECLNPKYWAGTTPENPAVLEQWEVEHFMKFLDSGDSMLRKKTLGILCHVDKNILSSYYAGALHNLTNAPVDAKAKHVRRVLEVIEARAGGDDDSYVRDTMDLLGQVDPSSPDGQVFEDAVDMILSYIRQLPDDSRRKSSTDLLGALSDPKRQLGPTTMVIMSALACENSGRISSQEVLQGLSSRLAYCQTPVQDVCLLAMLRISIDCDDISDEIVGIVSKLREASGKHIKRRCDQFLQFSSDKVTLSNVIRSARSPSLPDFLSALQKYLAGESSRRLTSTPSSSPGSPVSSPKSESLSASKLRYTAYDAPVPTARLRVPHASNSNYSSETSVLGSPRGSGSPKLLAGGELALAASTAEFESETSATDLIAFDSPFVPDPTETQSSQQGEGSSRSFDKLWEDFEAETRGWYGKSIDQLLRRVQQMDPLNVDVSVIETSLPPFLGECRTRICDINADTDTRRIESGDQI